ncbi:hypothetical protein Dip518_000626 [Parelusimicrobium proximum]|uniref:hypothetical protein n=1 Tax=Parelusimicrobium proximum TaxID=3228953 RepID=UPI003D174E32
MEIIVGLVFVGLFVGAVIFIRKNGMSEEETKEYYKQKQESELKDESVESTTKEKTSSGKWLLLGIIGGGFGIATAKHYPEIFVPLFALIILIAGIIKLIKFLSKK